MTDITILRRRGAQPLKRCRPRKVAVGACLLKRHVSSQERHRCMPESALIPADMRWGVASRAVAANRYGTMRRSGDTGGGGGEIGGVADVTIAGR